MSDALNPVVFGSFVHIGWSWRHSDLGFRLQYDYTNVFEDVDSSLFRFGVFYSHRF